MIWYWIVLIVLAVLCVFYVCAGYAFFCFVCKPKREASASLDGKGGRSLNAYRPFIQEKALQNSKLPHKMVSISAYDAARRAQLDGLDRFGIRERGSDRTFGRFHGSGDRIADKLQLPDSAAEMRD